MEFLSETRLVPDILNDSTQYLTSCGIENARLNAECLLSSTLNCDRSSLYLNFDRPLEKQKINQFKKKLNRRAAREPLQYIIGRTEFMSLPFKLNRHVLIPRPETEILVEAVIEKCKIDFPGKEEISILDIGTGSGCIAISLARYLPNSHLTAIDVSRRALILAKENAGLNQVEHKIKFANADFISTNKVKVIAQKFDVIVSNPPYVSRNDYVNLPEEIKDFEPPIALQDNANGLTFYYEIARYAANNLQADGFLAVEVGMAQAKIVKNIMQNNKLSQVSIHTDLNNIERVLIGRF